MDCSNRHDEAKAIRRGDIASTPTAGEVDAILRRDETGVRMGQCLLADIILPNPAQPRTPEGGSILPQQWFEALHASATRTAQTLVLRSPARASASLAWVNAPANPVLASISSSNSGKSTCGKRSETACRRAMRLPVLRAGRGPSIPGRRRHPSVQCGDWCRLQVNRRLDHFRPGFLQSNRRLNRLFAAKSWAICKDQAAAESLFLANLSVSVVNAQTSINQ
jgi:hypothetical protein